MLPPSLSWHHTLIFGAIGLATGLVTYLIQPFGGPLTEWLTHNLLGFSDAVEIIAFYGPGLIFGAAIGIWLGRITRRQIWRAAGLAIAGGASWYAAIWAAVKILEWVGDDHAIIIGPSAGALGAAIMVAGCALFYPETRQKGLVATVIGAGIVLGFVLHISVPLLFPVWQTGIAALIGDSMYRASRA